jgi:hypothetical protein
MKATISILHRQQSDAEEAPREGYLLQSGVFGDQARSFLMNPLIELLQERADL